MRSKGPKVRVLPQVPIYRSKTHTNPHIFRCRGFLFKKVSLEYRLYKRSSGNSRRTRYVYLGNIPIVKSSGRTVIAILQMLKAFFRYKRIIIAYTIKTAGAIIEKNAIIFTLTATEGMK